MKPRRLFSSKKAQVEVQFNWIYVLIAGAVILAFFGSLVLYIKDKTGGDRELEALNALKFIFTGAGVSEKTKNFIEIPEMELAFACEEGASLFSRKGGERLPTKVPFPVFSPSELKSKQLAAWSLPYKFPFKITDILMLSSAKNAGGIKYYIVGESPVLEELKKNLEAPASGGNSWPGFDVSFISSVDEAADENNYAVRLIFLSGSPSLPDWAKSLPPERVSGLTIEGKTVSFLSVKEGKFSPGPSFSLPSITEGNDPLVYAAIFADDEQAYHCQMQKVLNKMKKILLVYESKNNELKIFYQQKVIANPLDGGYQICSSLLNKITGELSSMKLNIDSCASKLSGSACQTLVEEAAALREDNTNLVQQGCAQLY